MEKIFEKNTWAKRVKSMLKVDLRRMFTTPFFYIMVGISLAMPILILVMTTMMDGTVSVNPQTGAETIIEGFDNVWQIIGTLSGGTESSAQAGMDMVSMCNINLLYFIVAVLVCVFVSEDFRSGYVKNLFTVRAKRTEYVFSKTLVCFLGGGAMVIAFFLGALVGGGISSLPFTMEGFHGGNLLFCILSKVLLMSVFVPLYLLMATIAKQRLWLSILLSMGVGMFLFMMIPMFTPLNANFLNVLLCIAGGGMLGVGLGAISKLLLTKRNIL